MHLLEAIGVMTSARSARPEVSSSPGRSPGRPVDRAAIQLSLVRDLLASLVNQLLALIEDSDRLKRYGEQLADVAAWKFGSLGALACGHNPSTHDGASSSLFFDALIAVHPVIVEFARFKQSRSRSIIYLHRMVQCIGPLVIRPAAICLPVFFQCFDITDAEHPIQLISQLMAEFAVNNHAEVLAVVDSLLPVGTGRLTEMYIHLLGASPPEQTADNEADTDTTLELDRVYILKQYLAFIQHITTHHYQHVLVSERNISLLPDILNNLVSGLRGGEEDGISVGLGIPLRRSAMISLTNLTRLWIAPDGQVSPSVSQLLVSVLCDQALPIAFKSFSGGVINPSDPQSQAYIGDIAFLLWTLASVGREDAQKFIQTVLLPGLGWNPQAIVEVSRLFEDIGTAHNFRESFKKLIRRLSNK